MNNEVKLSDATYEQLLSELQTKYGVIRHVWMVEDIKSKAEDMGHELNDDEINDIVSSLEKIDCNIGINWDSIASVIDMIKG